MDAIQVCGWFIQSQDMSGCWKCLSQGHTDDEGSQYLLTHRTSALHLNQLVVLLHHDAVPEPAVLLLGHRIYPNKLNVLGMVHSLPDIEQDLVNLVHFLVVKSVSCSLHWFHCILDICDHGAEGIVSKLFGQVYWLLLQIAIVQRFLQAYLLCEFGFFELEIIFSVLQLTILIFDTAYYLQLLQHNTQLLPK